MASESDGSKETHCGRRIPDPWWTNVTTETTIALYEGVKDAKRLKRVLNDA